MHQSRYRTILFGGVTTSLLACSITFSTPLFAQDDGATTPPVERKEKPKIYDEKANATKDVEAAIARAKKENRRVLIQWGANWCGWCHLLHDVFKTNREIARKLLYEYEVVLVDIDNWDKNLELAERFKADFKSNGVPYLTVLDGEGKVIANQDTGSLEEGNHHDPAKVLAFLEKHQAPYLSAESIYNEGIAKAKRENKIAFVHFGAPWCGWCHKLEDWLARKDVAKVFDKQYIDVKIDTDRTIGGQEFFKTMKDGKNSGIPWFAFVDGEGKVLATAFDSPDGKNIGCPYTDEEIELFCSLIKKTSEQLKIEDIAFLRDSLKEGRKDK